MSHELSEKSLSPALQGHPIALSPHYILIALPEIAAEMGTTHLWDPCENRGLFIHLSHLPEGIHLYQEKEAAIIPVICVDGEWTFSYETLIENKIFMVSLPQAPFSFDTYIWLTISSTHFHPTNVPFKTNTIQEKDQQVILTPPRLFHMDLEVLQEMDAHSSFLREETSSMGANALDWTDYLKDIDDADLVYISGLLPGTIFYDFGPDGVLYPIGSVNEGSVIILTGEDLKNGYFDSPVDFNKMSIQIKVTHQSETDDLYHHIDIILR